jgi:hypothetical protein
VGRTASTENSCSASVDYSGRRRGEAGTVSGVIRSIAGAAVLGAALVVALVGCAPATHSPHHSPAAGPPSASASPSPTPTPVATKPALADLVLSADGLGEIAINAPVPSSTLLVSLDPNACVSSEAGVAAGAPDAAGWIANYPPPDPANPAAGPFIVENHDEIASNPVDTIWVWAAGIHTETGIQVGSTLHQVQAAYPHPDATQHGPISDVYVIDGSAGKLVLEIARADSGDVGYWSAAQAGKVLWMGAVTPDAHIGPIAATDGGPSTCPHVNTG